MRYPDSDKFLTCLGERIRELRKAKNLSQSKLGLNAFIEKSTIQRIERGLMNCTVKTLIKISNSLDVEYMELFNFSNNNEHHKEENNKEDI
jgi:transcriptional regulator with XRE-family HTH domain